MRLRSFKVKDYRSIKSTLEIDSSSNLTIVGPNNEGKSNLVTALVTALQLLENHARSVRPTGLRLAPMPQRVYVWERDCPLALQKRQGAASVFQLKFEMDDNDQEEFYQAVGSKCNKTLPITVKIDRTNRPSFEVNKPGKGYVALNGKSEQIARFVGSKLSINYITAVRTARDAARSVEGLVSAALRQVERTPEYVTALKTIQDLQRPVLDEIASRLQESLQTFVPSVNRIELQVREGRAEALRSVEIAVDDGQLTPLSSKGDGVISLVGMALLAKLDTLSGRDVNLILVIEEPESHLHPRAINGIRGTLDGLPQNIQVMITTHSPNLINRAKISSNIVVETNVARVAKSISEIRDVLGVRVSDNLTNARLNVICEGLSECRSLPRVFSDVCETVGAMIQGGEIRFANLRGSGNLSFLVNYTHNSVCEPFVFLDDDDAGRSAFTKAKGDGLLDDMDVVFATRPGKANTEFEDLVRQSEIEKILKENFAVDTSKVGLPPAIKAQKFSDRMQFFFKASGRNWSEQVEEDLKTFIASRVADAGIAVLEDFSLPIIESAVGTIKLKLKLS
jgi:predicted ATPase